MLRNFILFCFVIPIFLNAESDLQRLLKGNQRFVEGKLLHPNRTIERRKSVRETQEPFAVIVACSDSRVSPEIIFDEGIGDLFVVRLAGNIIDPTAKESISYAVHHLHSSIILVLGHENCGAVDAVLHHQDEDIPEIAAIISPSVRKVRNVKPKDQLTAAIKANATRMRNMLTHDKKFSELITKNKLQVFSGYYHLKSGKVEILEP